MYIGNKHSIGSVVYLLTDEDQLMRVVTAITVRSGGFITYELSCGAFTSWHVEVEITKTKVFA